jgi:hypothetical protein
MKIILLLVCAVTLLASTGCVFRDGRDHSDIRDHRQYGDRDEHLSGVDHGEHPGDRNHDENR